MEANKVLCLVIFCVSLTVLSTSSAFDTPTKHDSASHNAGAEEYCEWEALNATCSADSVVVIEMASYGRMRAGRCVTSGLGPMGCSSDVTAHLDKLCSGKSHCYVDVSSIQRQTRPCPKDYKSFLEVKYTCVNVLVANGSSCGGHVTQEKGIAASLFAINDGSGSVLCPWVIEVKSYQKINVSLVDFSTAPNADSWTLSGASASHLITCSDPLATIVDSNDGRKLNICTRGRRYSHVFTSESNRITLTLSGRLSNYFLLQYEAIGCPPIVAPPNSILRRRGDYAAVQCNDTDEAWYLTCHGREWVGSVGNCSVSAHTSGKTVESSRNDMMHFVTTFPFGILAVVALGVAIGVAIGVFLLVAVLTYMKRLRRRKVRSRSDYAIRELSPTYDIDKQTVHEYLYEDRTPIVLRREMPPVMGHTTPKSPGGDSWIRRQGLPLPPTPEIGSHMPHSLTAVSILSAPPDDEMTNKSPAMTADVDDVAFGFTSTFRSSRRSDYGVNNTRSLRHHHPVDMAVFRTGCERDGPYYFKLDPSLLERDQVLRPDVLRGCTCRSATTPLLR